VPADEIIRASAKTGAGVDGILEAVVDAFRRRKRMCPTIRALIFDSKYDVYKGVVAYVRVVDGQVTKSQKLRLMSSGLEIDALEVGAFRPKMVAGELLETGQVVTLRRA